MHILAVIVGLFLVVTVLLDAFETIVLPRTVMRRIRLSNSFWDFAAKMYRKVGKRRPTPRRQALLVAWAPFVLLLLIVIWAFAVILGWAFVHWGLQTPFKGDEVDSFSQDFYFSGVTFLTLGYGDVVPIHGLGRFLAVIEAGLGFGFLALIVSYVPVLYNAFSRREVQMLLLDSRAGSEPMGSELLQRHADSVCMSSLTPILKDWERFGAELLESYLSYPLLAYYRSQHDNQSWLKSLTAVMDACALIEAGFQDSPPWADELRFQARATFAMGRHVVVDLAYILDAPPEEGPLTRLSPGQLKHIRGKLAGAGVPLRDSAAADKHLEDIRQIYEPYVIGMATVLMLDLPKWCEPEPLIDNWQTSAWEGAKHF